MGSSIRWALEG